MSNKPDDFIFQNNVWEMRIYSSKGTVELKVAKW